MWKNGDQKVFAQEDIKDQLCYQLRSLLWIINPIDLVLGRPLWRTRFERFFGLEDEPVKSVKMKVETRSGILWRLPHEFALCSLQGLCYVSLCGTPFANKTLNPTNVRFRLKARGLLLS